MLLDRGRRDKPFSLRDDGGMRAVVFDFFGTLTDPGAESDRQAPSALTAAALGVPAERFWAAMGASFPDRIVGRYGDTRATLSTVARQCGGEPDGPRLDAAVAAQRAGAERV